MAITLTDNQQKVFDQIVDFLSDDNENDTFILRGYAGTGKTTMAAFITSYLEEKELKYIVMAPTGRAAKVIQSKVGQGRTIHSAIYEPEVECQGVGQALPYKSYALNMRLRLSLDTWAIIIDESSMISDKKDKDNFFKTRGTLLEDLFAFARYSSIPKIIFIGDNAQLPPVSCAKSYALDADYLREEHGRKVEVAELSEVLRQKGDSGILKEATEMRESLKETNIFEREHSIDSNDLDIEEIGSWDIPELFCEASPTPEIGKNIIISYTNRLTNQRNDEIREIYFGEENERIEKGDIILVCNNTSQKNIKLHNGDFAQIKEIGHLDTQYVDVLDDEKNEIVHIKLEFRGVTIKHENMKIPIPIILLENFIHSKQGQLPDVIRKGLYINFCERHPELSEGTEDFSNALRSDPYFNCVHAKYGYAITCHKSQGGEWDTVFVDYSDKNGKANEDIRWAYTATTRARRKLYIINPPHNKPL